LSISILPLTFANFRYILTVLVDVVFLLVEFVLKHLFIETYMRD
jgi:hypothetical protein